MSDVELEIVVAIDRAWGIGKGGTIPWRIPEDMAHFKAVTTSGDLTNAVIMGRLTWRSIPARFRPLPGRTNVVLSRNSAFEVPPDAQTVGGLDAALKHLEDRGHRGRTFVIGGAAVYDEALRHPLTTAIHLTQIDATFDCDVFIEARPSEIGFERAACGDWKVNAGGVRFRFERWTREIERTRIAREPIRDR